MFSSDPLREWLVRRAIAPEIADRLRSQALSTLDQLNVTVGELVTQVDPDEMSRLQVEWEQALPELASQAPSNLAQAHALYMAIYRAGGPGSTYIQDWLLELIAAAQEPASIPFWLQVLGLSRPRETGKDSRRKMALSALALLAIQRNLPAAYDALRQAARLAQPDVRALALHYWSRAYLDAERSLPPQVLDDLLGIALNDTAFEPRFQARRLLQAAGRPAPLDNPGGAYAFKIKWTLRGRGTAANERCYRTIELRSEQTLDDLHHAIQHAIRWDADHLYSFYMNGKLRDERYRFSCPFEDDHPPWTDEAIIGELGLVIKHKFLYYFDYGDCHQFEVQVVGICPQAEAGDYPRITASQGKAPKQYGR